MSAKAQNSLTLTVAKAVVLIVLLGWLAYANSFSKVFHLDDNIWILANDDLPHWTLNVLRHMQRPVVALSLTANWKLGGIHPEGYHFVNLVIHIAAGLTLFGLVRRTLLLPRWRHAFDDSALGLAFATAALWTVHPLNTHSVTYIIQRCESGMGLGYVLTLYALLRGSQAARPALWYAGAILAAWLGIGCKEVMITILPVALLFDRVFLADSWREIARRRWPVYLGLASIFLLPIRSHLQNLLFASENDGQSASFALPNLGPKTYFLTELTVLPHYLRLALWPAGLCFDYRDWPPPSAPLEYVPSGLALTAAFLACAYGLYRRNGFAFLGMSMFLVLSLTSSFLPLLDVANEYRMYVPLMALTAGVVIGGYLALRRLWPSFAGANGAPAVLLAPALGALLVLTFQRNEDYRSSLALWEDVLAKRPTNYKAYNHLGHAYMEEAKWEDAKKNHLLCLERLPGFFFSVVEMGMMHYRAGDSKEGLEYLDAAIRAVNTHCETTSLGARFLHLEGTPEKSAHALKLLDWAKENDPHKALPRFSRAQVLRDLGRHAEADVEFAEAAALFPTWHERYQKLAREKLRGRFGDSRNVRRETLFFASMAVGAEKNLDNLTTQADAYAWNDRYADAAAALRDALALTLEHPLELRRQLSEKLRAAEWKAK